jgi:tRNA G18 (ribose-2'-O)-methylase SpoU
MFRTADALGVSRIYLSGYTPRPLDRFGRTVKDIHKTALGAEQSISWESVTTPAECIKELTQQGFQVIAIEQDQKAVDYKTLRIGDKVLCLVGNEVRGLSSQLLALCDCIVEIPMKGEKESLNVSVAFGVALFRMLDQ